MPKHISGDNMTISDIDNESIVNDSDKNSELDSISIISDDSSVDISDDHMNQQHFQFVPNVQQPRMQAQLSPRRLRSGTVLRYLEFVKRHYNNFK